MRSICGLTERYDFHIIRMGCMILNQYQEQNGGEVGQVSGAKGDVAPVLTSIMFSSYILGMSKVNSEACFSFCEALRFF